MENGDNQMQQRERVDHERRRLAESRRRKGEKEHKQRFTKEDSKRRFREQRFREQRIRRRNDSGRRGYIRVPGNKLPHLSFPRTLDGRSGCANSTIRKSARPEDKDQKHHLQDCDPCPEQRNLSSTEGNSDIEQQTRTFCSSRGNNEDLLWDCLTRTSDGSRKPSQDHHRSNRCNSDDSVGCIHQAGIANKEHQSQMGRLCPSTIYSSRPSRLIHSKTIYSGSGEVLQMPKIRAHNGAGLDQALPEAATQINDSQDVNLSTGMAKALDGMGMPRELKIVHWKAQGANRKRALITSCIINEGIDIMLIQDTRLKNDKTAECQLEYPGTTRFTSRWLID